MKFELTILGSSSATPTKDRNQSAFLVKYGSKCFLIDCGEGTQLQLIKYKINIQKINHIFISHLHGDHFFGLVGLLSTFNLQGRVKKIDIFAPHHLQQIIVTQLKYSNTILRFKINFYDLDFSSLNLLTSVSGLDIFSFPLNHSIECCGFLFAENPKPRAIIKEKLPVNHTLEDISKLLSGKDIEKNGKKYLNSELTLPPSPQRIFAYCSDTAPSEQYLRFIENCSTLYHEATFMDDMKERAEATKHSTTFDAAEIAKKINAKKLIIGHFSARYKNLSTFVNQAKTIFENSYIAAEGKTFEIE